MIEERFYQRLTQQFSLIQIIQQYFSLRAQIQTSEQDQASLYGSTQLMRMDSSQINSMHLWTMFGMDSTQVILDFRDSLQLQILHMIITFTTQVHLQRNSSSDQMELNQEKDQFSESHILTLEPTTFMTWMVKELSQLYSLHQTMLITCLLLQDHSVERTDMT